MASVLTLAVLPLSLSAQDYLHYKFDTGCGTDVINFAEASTAGPAVMISSLPGAPASSWTTGQWGGGMAGSDSNGENYVDCNWNPGTYTGSFSISMWIRNKPGNPAAIAFGYLFGASGSSFRCFTGSSGKLFVGGWGGSGNFVNANDLTALLNAGYVHVALVVDQASNVYQYHINGVADPAVAFTGSVSFGVTDFSVGKYSTSTASPMNFDEFLFTKRVLTPTEITLLSTSPQAGAGRYGVGNPATMVPGGGRPSIGNQNFTLTINDPQAQSYILFIGSGRCQIFGGVTLPVDLGKVIPAFAGVLAFSDIDILRVAGGMSGGSAVVGLPVPQIPSLSGYTSHWQAYTVTAQGALRGANSVAISPGH